MRQTYERSTEEVAICADAGTHGHRDKLISCWWGPRRPNLATGHMGVGGAGGREGGSRGGGGGGWSIGAQGLRVVS